jgi:spermidine dehydrogenase
MAESDDKELGMGRRITRRDFLNGVAVTAGARIFAPHLLGALPQDLDPEKLSGYYPPGLTGLRGSHAGSFEVAHSLRDGDFWQNAGSPKETGEQFDLVVVGGGISGLSAAYFFRKSNPNARILILENHDDFGGHAKRNEFTIRDRRLLGYGGTFAIESPAPYSSVAKQVVEELGIDVPSFAKFFHKDLYGSLGLVPRIFFDRQTFGTDKLVVNPSPLGMGESGDSSRTSPENWKRFASAAPLSLEAIRDLERLFFAGVDYLPGLTSEQKKDRLARISYAKFLTDVAGVSPELVKLYQATPHGLFGVGIDAVSAQDAWGLGLPGFSGMKLDPGPGKGMNRDAIPNAEAEKYFFHFPDGNASIARLLVRTLIPEAMPGSSVLDLVMARANYAHLDQPSSPVRIRLNSTVVRVRHLGDPAQAEAVEICYSRRGKLQRVRAPHVVLACWHMVIPYICPELPERQKQALHTAAKVPLLYTNVAIRDWTAFQKLETSSVYAPGGYHTAFTLDLPVSIGKYQCSTAPDQPIVIHMMKTPCRPGFPARDQHRFGRIELFTTDFRTMERKIRDQLAGILGPGGFDPARDIQAITVNRWPHGYSPEYNPLFDPEVPEEQRPNVLGRARFGRITIANSDSGAAAYTDSAINQAHRAVNELLGALPAGDV